MRLKVSKGTVINVFPMTKNQCHGRFVESFGRLHLARSLHEPVETDDPLVDFTASPR